MKCFCCVHLCRVSGDAFLCLWFWVLAPFQLLEDLGTRHLRLEARRSNAAAMPRHAAACRSTAKFPSGPLVLTRGKGNGCRGSSCGGGSGSGSGSGTTNGNSNSNSKGKGKVRGKGSDKGSGSGSGNDNAYGNGSSNGKGRGSGSGKSKGKGKGKGSRGVLGVVAGGVAASFLLCTVSSFCRGRC